MSKFSKSEAIKFGWGAMKANFWKLLGILAVAWLIIAVLSWVTGKMPSGLSGLFSLATVAVELVIGIGLIRIALKVCDGQPIEIGDIFSGYPLIWKYFLVSILVGLITFTGFILLIIPGIIWALKYQFATYLVVDKGSGVMEAIKKSGQMTAGEKWNLFVFGLLLGLMNVAGALALGFGLLATVPTTMIAAAYVYRKLLAAQDGGVVVAENTAPIVSSSANTVIPPAQ